MTSPTHSYLPASPLLRAALWMSGAIISFLTMAVAGRVLAAELDTFEIMTWRSITGFLIVLGIVAVNGAWSQVSTHRLGLHAVRNIAHFTGQNLWFYAITVIPLAQVFALEFSAPLWVLVLSPLLLAERMTWLRGLAGIAGFAGILIITRPWAHPITPGLLAAAACAIAFAGTIVSTKLLTRDVSTLGILFWLTGMQMVFGMICGGYDGDFAVPSAGMWPWAILVGLAGLFAHFCLTSALAIAPASVVSPMDFLRLPAAAIVGLLLYQEALDPYVLVGAAVIFGANYANVRSSSRA